MENKKKKTKKAKLDDLKKASGGYLAPKPQTEPENPYKPKNAISIDQ